MIDPTSKARRSWFFGFLACLVSMDGLGADDGAKPARQVVPEPPEQGRPWVTPATRMPRYLFEATRFLFERGVPDPRGCEYREFEFENGQPSPGRGFVLPEQPGVTGRFAIGWDGQLYRAARVGHPADLDRDVRTLAPLLGHDAREQGWAFPASGEEPYGVSGVMDRSPIKLFLLLRLGRVDLAETLFAGGTSWTASDPERDLGDVPITDDELATEWLSTALGVLVDAHLRGDDALALDTARRIKTFREASEARLVASGVPRPMRVEENEVIGPGDYFPVLTEQFEQLRLDHEQRALLPERGPIPKHGSDPAARVAALIRYLDQIAETPMSNPGGVHPEESPLIEALVEEGPAAVEPLLTVLETDQRLTRTVSSNGNNRYIHPVYEPVFSALIRLMPTGEFPGQRPEAFSPLSPELRKTHANQMREHWRKTRDLPLAEQWYRVLLDDKASPDRWVGAAHALAFPPEKHHFLMPPPGSKPCAGESLRLGKEPSVGSLMGRRLEEIQLKFNPDLVADDQLILATDLVTSLSNWDGPAALPWLREMTKEWRMRSDICRIDDSSQGTQGVPTFGGVLAELTTIRVRLGDPGALDDYAAWISSTTPIMLSDTSPQAVFQPMIDHPDQPRIAWAARWIFTNPISPWLPIAACASTNRWPPENVFASPLLKVKAFREGLLAGLQDRTAFGAITRIGVNQIQISFGTQPLPGGYQAEGELPNGGDALFRECDYIASKLSEIPGAPVCDLTWPEPKRDEAVKAIIAFLKRFGDRFVGEGTPILSDYSGVHAALAFPTLGRPASLEDVACGRAIFSLEGRAERRAVALPDLPQHARRLGSKENEKGRVWQAEEVLEGGSWVRYYGFVEQHSVEKVAASEIEFVPDLHRGNGWGNLSSGLDARLKLSVANAKSYRPDRPIVVGVEIRNRMGVDRSSPTEFVRVGDDGKPSLRRGITLELRRWTPSPLTSPSYVGATRTELTPRRSSSFEPGSGTRRLAALEAFEAFTLDVNDWFDVSKPGQYQLFVTFEAASGLGEGTSAGVRFQVGDDE